MNSTVVKVNLKFVRNLGNYESMHVEFGVEDWVREVDEGSVDKATDRVYKFVEEKLVAKVNELESQLKK